MPNLRKWLLAALLALLFLAAPGLADPAPVAEVVEDLPRGYPYNTGRAADTSQVPLRDFLSSRMDQLEHQLLRLLDERDRQYAQRFAAQQEALQAALQAAEKAVANALSAAKEAVLKAEEASKDKFAGINELRGSLNDVIRLQMPRLEAEARFNGIDEKLRAVEARVEAITNSNQGANETWALIGGGVLLLLALGTFAMTIRRDQRAVRR